MPFANPVLPRVTVQSVLQAADQIGIRALVVQAISEDARRFYLVLGFDPYPGDPRMLVVTLKDARAAVEVEQVTS